MVAQRARENRLYAIYVNLAGYVPVGSEDRLWAGTSAAFLQATLLARRFPSEGDPWMTAEIDPARQEAMEAESSFLRERRPDVYGALLAAAYDPARHGSAATAFRGEGEGETS